MCVAGKTTLATAAAVESGMNIIVVRAAEVRSKVVGDSEKAVAKVFAQVCHTNSCDVPCHHDARRGPVLRASCSLTSSSPSPPVPIPATPSTLAHGLSRSPGQPVIVDGDAA